MPKDYTPKVYDYTWPAHFINARPNVKGSKWSYAGFVKAETPKDAIKRLREATGDKFKGCLLKVTHSSDS